MPTAALLPITLLALSALAHAAAAGVTYDGRSLFVNGKREIFLSGSIHYPRSMPDMWPDLIRKAKLGGLNTIDTYVFWNLHEPAPGKYFFGGNYDFIKFFKLIQQNNMYALLRIGPFIQSEWFHGGLPFWLREVNNITFRTDNPPFKYYMKRFVKKIVRMVQAEKLFASQGGPIILSQIENEYKLIEDAFGEAGRSYIQWAANMAVGMNTGVPWVMCKQSKAPGPVIGTCNARHCADMYVHNQPGKPYIWTENWTMQYRSFGDPPAQRSAEDLAYSIARFFSVNGTLANYYMYHGGTNFARTSADFVTTRYYDEAPLDEYGLEKEPKWGHLRDLHHALRLCRKGLLWGSYSYQKLGPGFEARVYEWPEQNVCAAFLTNTNPNISQDGTVNFRGVNYFLARKSVSILPDCKTVTYNTQRINAQHNTRTFYVAKLTQKDNVWQMYQDLIPKYRQTSMKTRGPMEHYNATKDTSDYLWYTTSFKLDLDDLPMRQDIEPVLGVDSLGHGLHAFVNGHYIGTGHGSKVQKKFDFVKPINLRPGANHIALLSFSTGLQDGGAYLEHRYAGVRFVRILGLNAGTVDMTMNGWGHEVGLVGEKMGIFKEEGTSRVQWSASQGGRQVTWYKRYFNAPNGNDPVAVDMSSMGRGLVWINGECIGRYWVSYLSPLGKPSQSFYHIPRGWLKPTNNLMVVFEEHGGKPEGIVILNVKRDNICSYVSELHPAQLSSSAVAKDVEPQASLKCGLKKVINQIMFASFGNPSGVCGNYTVGNCHTRLAKLIIEKLCLGQRSCKLPVSYRVYGADPACPGTTGTLAVQAKCSRRKVAAA